MDMSKVKMFTKIFRSVKFKFGWLLKMLVRSLLRTVNRKKKLVVGKLGMSLFCTIFL